MAQKTFTVSVGANSSATHNETGFANLAYITKIKVTPSIAGGSTTVQIYARDTFLAADILHLLAGTGTLFDPADIDSAGTITERNEGLVARYRDSDATAELHLKIINNDASARDYTVVVDYDEVQTLGLSASPTFAGLTLSGLTASRLVATNGSKALASVADLSAWIAGTANQVTVASDGDGTVTLSGPQDLHPAAAPTFASVNLSGNSNQIVLDSDGTYKLTLTNQTLTGNRTFTIPNRTGRGRTGPVYVVEGDSLSNDNSDWPGFLDDVSDYFGQGQLVNYATAGNTADTMVGQYEAEAHTQAPTVAGDERWFFLLAGINDLNGGVTAYDIYDDLQTLWANARADGFRVVAMTVLHSTALSAGEETQRQALNAMILSDPALYDYVVQPDLVLDPRTRPEYFADATHLNATGSELLARLVDMTIRHQPWMLAPVYPWTSAEPTWNLALNPTGAVTVPGSLTAEGTLAVSGAVDMDSTADITGPIRAALGSVSAPAYAFTGDTNTGIYSSGADVIDFSAGNSRKVSISTYGLQVGVAPAAGQGQIEAAATSAGKVAAKFRSYASPTCHTLLVEKSDNTAVLTVSALASAAAALKIYGADPATLGDEIVGNGDFSDLTGWATANGTSELTTNPGKCTSTRNATGTYLHLYQTVTTVAGVWHRAQITFYGTLSSGMTAVDMRAGTGLGLTTYGSTSVPAASIAADYTMTLDFLPTGATTYLTIRATGPEGAVAVFDDATCKPVTGGDVAAMGKFTGGGASGIDIDATGVATFDATPIIPTKTPSSAGASGTTGEVAWDGDFLYVCVGTDTWKRAAIASWP